MMAKHIDAVSPMMYANGMRTYFKDERVTKRVYSIIHCGLWRARQKAPAIVLRPYLQAYPDGARELFGPAFVREQLRAAERAGSNGFLFWNAGMRSGMVYWTLGRDRTRVEAFGSNPAQHKEPANSPGAWCPLKGMVFGGQRAGGSAEGARTEGARTEGARAERSDQRRCAAAVAKNAEFAFDTPSRPR
jgi:hypothetical protein